jgi:hypothetical protein
MLTPDNDIETVLDFHTAGLRASVFHSPAGQKVAGRAIVVNLGSSDARIHGEPSTPLAPLQSCVVIDAEISGQTLAVIRVLDEMSLISDARAGWQDFYASRGATADHPELLRSPQREVGAVVLDTAAVLRQSDLAGDQALFDVRLNLWFSPAGTACGIHNQHDFIEVHTQLVGTGRMQKFHTKHHLTNYEDHLMCVGNTNPATFCRVQDGEFSYPWHQYFADTDCIWMAIEYHVR